MYVLRTINSCGSIPGTNVSTGLRSNMQEGMGMAWHGPEVQSVKLGASLLRMEMWPVQAGSTTRGHIGMETCHAGAACCSKGALPVHSTP